MVDWTGADEDQADVNVWEDNWDDDNVEDDFSQQLRSVTFNTDQLHSMRRSCLHLFVIRLYHNSPAVCPSLECSGLYHVLRELAFTGFT